VSGLAVPLPRPAKRERPSGATRSQVGETNGVAVGLLHFAKVMEG
jgi:hypothetical protein